MSVIQKVQPLRIQKAPLDEEPPKPQLSPLRVLILLLLIAGAAFGAWKLVTQSADAALSKSHAVPVYAPYVDVTLTPIARWLPSNSTRLTSTSRSTFRLARLSAGCKYSKLLDERCPLRVFTS